MMRRLLAIVVAFGLVAMVAVVRAQQSGYVPVVGVLMVSAGPDDPIVEALREGLRELGYVEGRNIRIDFRGAQGHVDRLPHLAAELVQTGVDAIVVGTVVSAQAAKQASGIIPIVILLYDSDPVASGLIESLSRPGGNITGIFARQSDLVGKRLELLRETLPGLARVAVFWDSFSGRQLDELDPAARSLGMQLQLVELQAPYNFKTAFKTVNQKKAGAVMMLFSPEFYMQRSLIAALALKNRLPTVFQNQEYVEDGGLLSYGPSRADTFGRAAYFIDRLLKGAKPRDLPVEQADTFKLTVNLKTAKALGITLPQSILLRADKVIR